MSTDSFDIEYSFGRPVETYLTVREHARLVLRVERHSEPQRPAREAEQHRPGAEGYTTSVSHPSLS